MQKNPQGFQANWDKVEFDLGNVKMGTRKSISFTLKNSNLKIIKQRASCGCTATRIDNNKVTGSFSTPKNNGKSTMFSKKITVTLEDIVTKAKQVNILTIKGTAYRNESDIPS